MRFVAALFLASLFSFVLVLPRRAAAGELEPLTIEDARADMIRGQTSRARAVLTSTAALPDQPEYAAAAKQLLAILDDWEAHGRPRQPRRPPAMPDAGDDWTTKMRLAVLLVADGWYARGATLLTELVPSAPDAVSRTVAREVRALAVAATESEPPPRDEVITPPAAEPSKEKSGTSWYGWQSLIVDGASVVTAPLYCLGCLGYVFGGPIIHAAHDRWGAAAASLGLRVGAPVLFIGALTGFGEKKCGGDFGCVGEVLLGGVFGIATAVAIDDALLARETIRPKQREASLRMMPSAAPRREGGVDVGLAGTF